MIVNDELVSRGLLSRVGGDQTYLEITSAAPHAGNVLHHAEILRDKNRRRQAIEVAHMVHRAAYGTDESTDSIVGWASQMLVDLEAGKKTSKPTKIGDLMPQVMSRLHQRREGQLFGVQTGFPTSTSRSAGTCPPEA